MHKVFFAVAAIFGGLAVVLGAFGAHGLQSITQDEKILHGFGTGVQYQMYHSLALLLIACNYERDSGKWIKRAAIFFIAGVVLFSGSLYLLTYLKINESNAANIAGPITPLGGLILILGWICLFIAAISSTTKP
jgi:uncharacterized membrane protein YgdD (TMEM256/DUF423 family)